MRKVSIAACGLLCLVVAMIMAAATVTSAEPVDHEDLDFDAAYAACRSWFLDGSIAGAWFADSLNAVNENQYRAQLDAGEITEDEYLRRMKPSYRGDFGRWDFDVHVVLPAGEEPNCQALVDMVGHEDLEFEAAWTACRSWFLDGSIAGVWFADSLNAVNEDQYRAQLDAGEITEDEYLQRMKLSYRVEFARWDFNVHVVLPAGEEPNCQALIGFDEPPPTTTVPPTTAPPTTAVPVPDDGDPGGFQWDDPNMRAAFELCMRVVDWSAQGREIVDMPELLDGPPTGVDGGTWDDAIAWREEDDNLLEGLTTERFTYRPRCDLLLPADYTSRVAIRYWSETFSRCLANVSAGDRHYERPRVVPAWYWEASMAIGDCYLLLPLGAFGLGDGELEENDWSQWSSDDEIEYPTDHPNADIMEEYNLCKEFITWRMETGEALNPVRPLGDVYDDPPRNASPKHVWHEAIDFYVDPNVGDGTATVPRNWIPNCELLLLQHECQPSDDGLIPDSCPSRFPTDHYDVGYSDRDVEPDGEVVISRTLWGASTSFAYFIGRDAMRVALWLVHWGFTFDISRFDPVALAVGDNYEDLLDSRLGGRIKDLFWLILFAWAGYTALRGRLAMAGSEVMLAIVLLLLAGVLMANQETYMTSTWRLMNEGSNTLLMAGVGGDVDQGGAGEDCSETENEAPGSPSQVIERVQAELHHVFVEETYDHLNWGQSLGRACHASNPVAACASARDYILSRAPMSTDPWPRVQMRGAGNGSCDKFAEFNRNPSGTRLTGAILMMTSSVIVALLMGLMALTIIVAKFVALLLFAVTPLAMALAILPGAGRRLTWAWCTTLLQASIGVVGMSFLLSLLLLTLTSVTSLTSELGLIERFLLMNLIVVIVWRTRQQLLTSGQRFAARLGEYLSATRGNGTTWASAAASSSNAGMDLLSVDRTVGATLGGSAKVVGVATGVPLVALYQRNVALRRAKYAGRLGYKNLVNISKWKRADNVKNSRWLHNTTMGKRYLDEPWNAPIDRQPLP